MIIGTVIQDRYRIESVLGQGGMGTVYRATDTLLERPVAIKVVSAAGLGTAGRSRLLQEARAAARLNHPNIVAVHDVGEVRLSDQDAPLSYIVMELVEGETLRDHEFRDLSEIIRITEEICKALANAHEQGIIHRDLKPENVTISVSDTVKLMDFGLARVSGETRLTQQGAFVGTLSYIAPEIILGQEASPSSDLYALGVMLYEMCAGRPPFQGTDLTAVISQHLHAPVVPPSAYNDQIPQALDRLIQDLMSKKPADRPASAEVARQALAHIGQVGFVSPAPAAIPHLNRLVRGRMIGREEEFSQAVNLWQQAAAGRGNFLLISGEPGIGKTRMVRELNTYAEISGGKALTGLCYADDRTPYGPIAQMVETSLEDGFNLDLPQPVLADLLSLSPELRLAYPGIPLNDRLDPEAEQQRLFESIVAWFSALTRSHELLFVVDDVHWADSGSLAMLRHLVRRIGRRRALVVATYREVELDEALPFQEMLSDLNRERLASRIKLTRLNREQTQELLATLFAEEITPEFLDGIYRETEGNPFFVEEVCKALVDSGELYFAGGRWHRPAMRDLDIPQGIKVAIQGRLGKLAPEEQDVLQYAALLGRDFEYEFLAAVVEQDEDALIDVLERAVQAQLIEEVRRPGLGQGLTFSFTHALIHSTILSNLSTLRRQRRQRRVALALEEAFPDRIEEQAGLLGRYFAEAGEGAKAVSYLLQAGDQARQVYAYEEAREAYEQALLFLREAENHQLAARTLMKLGLVYHNIFDFDASRRVYEEGFAEWQRAAASEAAVGNSLPPAPHPFRLPVDNPPTTLDPALAGDTTSIFWVNLLFSGLLELTAGDEIVPEMAQSWELLDDGTRYVFHLRDDFKWSNGTPVTAADFEFGLKRSLNPNHQFGLARSLYDIKGAQAYHTGLATDPAELGVRAIDAWKLEILLEQPCSYFLQAMALVKPQPGQVVERYGDDWAEPERIVTNGSFRIKTWRSAELLAVERSPDYPGLVKGNVTQCEALITSVTSHFDLYERDAVDLFFPFWSSPETGRRAIQLHPDEYISQPSGNTIALIFNLRRPPFDDKNVRQALVLATDRKTIINRSAKGIIFPATGGFVPSGIPGHVPGIALPFDPELARARLAEAGYPAGAGFPETELLAFGIAENINQLICAGWAEVLGIKINLELADFNTILERQRLDPPPIWTMGWSGDYPDPDSYLRVANWYHDSGWDHREYKALINDARKVTNQAQRMAMYRQAERILVEEAPILPFAYGREHFLLKPWIRTFPSPILGTLPVKDVVLDPH